MAVLVIADHDNAALSDATAKTVTAAKVFGGDVDVLVAGKGAGDVAGCGARRGLRLRSDRVGSFSVLEILGMSGILQSGDFPAPKAVRSRRLS